MPTRIRVYTAGCLCIGAGVAAASLWVASREWFFGDDFAFLWFARRFDALASFVPTGPRIWPTYRPLSIDVFFAALWRGFGLNPLPFLATSLAFHFASGFVVVRIARQLGMDARVAVFAGVLSIAMAPSMQTIFWVSAFQHVSAICFCLLAISSFLAFQEKGGAWRQAASCSFLLLALLSNELAAALPAVLAALAFWRADGPSRERAIATALVVLPQALWVGAYLVFRFGVITPAPMHPAYALTLGSNVFANALANASYLLHESWLFGLAFAALVVGAQLARREDPPPRRREGLLLGWMLAAALPTLAMPAILPRMTMILEAPMALLVADQLEAWIRRREFPSRWIEAGLLALLLLAIPYGTLYERGTHPEGQLNRELAQLLERHFPTLPAGSCVAIRVDPALAWDDDTLFTWRFRTHNLPSAVYGTDSHELLFERATDAPQRRCSANFQLGPNLKLTTIKRG